MKTFEFSQLKSIHVENIKKYENILIITDNDKMEKEIFKNHSIVKTFINDDNYEDQCKSIERYD